LATDWGTLTSRSFNGPIWSVSAEVAVYAGFFLLLRRYPPSLVMCASVAIIGLALQLYGFDAIPLSCAIFFFAGGMAAQVKTLRWPMRIVAGAIASGIIMAAGSAGILDSFSFSLMALLFALPFLLVALAGELPFLNRFQRGIQAAGNLTYSTYLLSFPLQLMFAVAVVWSGFMPDVSHPAFLLAYLAIVLAAGALCYRAFELPAQNWIRQRTLKPRAAAT
jgi:peptidoglycan/LPS O-acetylase OafA/YrhL